MTRGRWIVRGLLLFVLAFTNLNDIWSPDVLPNALFAWTVIRERNVDYDEFTVEGTPAPRPPARSGFLDREAYFFRACGVSTATAPPKAVRSPGGPPAPGPRDHVCSVFPPGMAVLALPFFAPFVLAGVFPDDLGLLIRVGHVAAAFFEVLATLLLWSVLRRFTSARWSLVLVLLYFLATSVRTVSSQALWQHPGVHLAVASALWLTLHEDLVPLRRELLAGAALGLGAIVRQTTGLVALGLSGFRTGRLVVVLIGAGMAAAPLLVYDDLAFGSALEQGYGVKPFDTPLSTGLSGLLVSPSRGLFVYTPYLVFAFWALARAWRWPGEVARRLRSLSLVWLATLLLYATYTEWWGGRVFGARFLDDLAPILFTALGWGTGVGLLRSRRSRVVFAALAAWSLVIFNAAALVYDQSWDTARGINFDPSPLFSWTDPQWLAVLAALPAGGIRVIAAGLLSMLVVALFLRLELRALRPEGSAD